MQSQWRRHRRKVKEGMCCTDLTDGAWLERCLGPATMNAKTHLLTTLDLTFHFILSTCHRDLCLLLRGKVLGSVLLLLMYTYVCRVWRSSLAYGLCADLCLWFTPELPWSCCMYPGLWTHIIQLFPSRKSSPSLAFHSISNAEVYYVII